MKKTLVAKLVEKRPVHNDYGEVVRFEKGDVFEVGDSARLGRHDSCDIRPQSGLVSRLHAEIRRNGNSYPITDLASRNGIVIYGEDLVNPKALLSQEYKKPYVLEDGDHIVLGANLSHGAVYQFILEEKM